MELEEEIDKRVGEVRTDTLDMSFGEIVNLHTDSELVIQPEYQRLFRWNDIQKSRLVESILLELPVPQIFVIENGDGVLELIDGLQRVSSVLQFMESKTIKLDPLVLDGCTLIESLNGMRFGDLPLSLRLRIKRSSVRVVVIKRQSQHFLRYEMFKRLNTGGSNLSAQEIRNCSSRMFGESGVEFYSFLVDRASDEDFKQCATMLSDPVKEQKGDEELVLRFFALKNVIEDYRGNVREWLDEYMEHILKGTKAFDYAKELVDFRRTFKVALEKLGESAFVRYRGESPIGSLAPAYFEAISMGIWNNIDKAEAFDPKALRDLVTKTIQTSAFNEVVGPGANTRPKLKERIRIVADALASA